MLITSFVGHGDVTRWGVEPFGGGKFIIEPADLAHLVGNDRLTFIVALDCLNGYFSQPFEYCLAEEWLMTPDKGAVACFAPSGLSYQHEHESLSRFIFSKIFTNKENRLGAITTESKIDTYQPGVSDKVLVSFNLIGDPATRLDFHRAASDLVIVHTIQADAGTGGTITPSGNIPVFDQSGQTFTVTPSAGYSVSDIIVDGGSQVAGGAFTFKNVTGDHTIHAVFKANAQPGGGGGGGGGGCFISAITPRL